jgi:hypothetical protein
MRLMGIAGVLAAVVLAGCGIASGGSDGFARQAARPSPTATPSTTAPFNREDLAAQTKKVLMAQADLLDLGGPTRALDVLDGNFLTTQYCGTYPNHEGGTGHVAHQRLWVTSAFTVSGVAHGYHLKTGREALREARESLQRCTSYEARCCWMFTDPWTEIDSAVHYDILGPVEFATPNGIEDSVGRCVRETSQTNGQRVVCLAYLGLKSLVSAVFVSAGLDEATARAKLLLIIPKAASALRSAG